MRCEIGCNSLLSSVTVDLWKEEYMMLKLEYLRRIQERLSSNREMVIEDKRMLHEMSFTQRKCSNVLAVYYTWLISDGRRNCFSWSSGRPT